MKFRIEKGYVVVISPVCVTVCGITTGRPRQTTGAAFYPFLFVRSEAFIQPWLINHERIHFRQQLETLFVGAFILEVIEKLYAVIILGKSLREAYLWSSQEQEAYLNHHDGSYLSTRRPYAQFHYLFHKRFFTLVAPGVLAFPDERKNSVSE